MEDLNYLEKYIVRNYHDFVDEDKLEKRTISYLETVLNNTAEEDIIKGLENIAYFKERTIEKPDWNPRLEYEICLLSMSDIPEFYGVVFEYLQSL